MKSWSLIFRAAVGAILVSGVSTAARIAAVASLALMVSPAVAQAAGTVTGVTASPSPAVTGAEVAITVAGTGPCRVYVGFGDKQKAALLSLLPGTVRHVYAAPGKYVIKTFTYTSGSEPDTLSRCGGFADMELVVNPAVKSKALAPDKVKVSSGAVSGVGAVANPAPGAGGAESNDRLRARAGGTPTPTPTKTVR